MALRIGTNKEIRRHRYDILKTLIEYFLNITEKPDTTAVTTASLLSTKNQAIQSFMKFKGAEGPDVTDHEKDYFYNVFRIRKR